MPFKDRETKRTYQREWYKRKKLGLPTRTTIKREKQNLEERRIANNECTRQYKETLKKQRDIVWGTKCILCDNSKYRLSLHRKDGKKHSYSLAELRRALLEPDEWVRLCYWCHIGVHFCMKYLKWNWTTIYRNIRLHT
jgi:hypothetical protein